MPEITVLHVSTSQVPDEKGVLHPLSHIVYQDEKGRIGTIQIPKAEPSDADIAAAIKKQQEEEAARKPRTVRL